MLEINEKVIKKQANAVIFDRGNTLYLNNYVKEIKVEYEKNSTLKVLEGVVTSLENRADLKTEILLGMKTETIEFSCECEDFKLSNKKKACKHIIATLLRYLKGQPKFVQLQLGLYDKIDADAIKKDVIVEEKSNIPSQLISTVSSEVIEKEADTFVNIKETIKEKKKSLIPKPVSRLQLKLEPQFIYSHNNKQASALLKLKIGDTSTYEIKDIRAFLLALKNKKALEIGPAFKFSPEKHSFKKSDIELLRLITTSNKFAAKKFDGDKVLLEDKEVKQFLTLMKNRSFDYIINDALYKNKSIIQSNLPLEFIVTTEMDKVILKQLTELPLPLCRDKDYYFFRGNIYLPNSIQSYRYSSLYDEFLSTGKNSKIYKGEDI